MRPDDLAWSDIGAWPSTGDTVASVTCAGCGCRGSRGLIAQETLCWSCWAQEYRRRLEQEAAS
jgi:hypothetical protein